MRGDLAAGSSRNEARRPLARLPVLLRKLVDEGVLDDRDRDRSPVLELESKRPDLFVDESAEEDDTVGLFQVVVGPEVELETPHPATGDRLARFGRDDPAALPVRPWR